MFELHARVLGYEVREYQGKDGTTKKFVAAVIRSKGRMFECQSAVDLTSYLDKDVVLVCDVNIYQGKSTGIVIRSVIK